MKILLIHNFYQQLGGERVAVEAQTTLLQERGHEVVRFTLDNGEINNYSIKQKINLFPNTIFNRDVYQELANLVIKEEPDVAHVHNVFPLISPSAYTVLKKMHIPILQTLHNYRFLCPNGLFFRRGEICERCKLGNTLHAIRWKCYRQSYIQSSAYAFSIGFHRQKKTFEGIDRFIALTEFSAQKIIDAGVSKPGQVSILGNFLPGSPDETFDVGENVPYGKFVLFLGRLSDEKGIVTLLDAMEKLQDLKLIIGGAGPQGAEYSEQVKKRGMENVKFLGHLVGKKKWQLLRNALATIVPSLCYENFPFVVLESASVGTPVIASRLGGLMYMIDNGKNGLHFAAGDSEDLRLQIEKMDQQVGLAKKLGANLERTYRENWSADAHYDKLMKIYSEVRN